MLPRYLQLLINKWLNRYSHGNQSSVKGFNLSLEQLFQHGRNIDASADVVLCSDILTFSSSMVINYYQELDNIQFKMNYGTEITCQTKQVVKYSVTFDTENVQDKHKNTVKIVQSILYTTNTCHFPTSMGKELKTLKCMWCGTTLKGVFPWQ